MAVNRSPVLMTFGDFKHAPCLKSLIWEIYFAKEIAKNNHNVGNFFSNIAMFQAIQSASYLFSTTDFVGSFFLGHLV